MELELEQVVSIIANICEGHESQQDLEALIKKTYDDHPELPKHPVDDLVPAIQSLFSTSIEFPQLLIDWKTLPSIGNQCTPQFLLVLTDDYQDLHPEVVHAFEPSFDCATHALTPSLNKTPEGHWEWFLPFALTQNNVDCRPGDYILTVQIKFTGNSSPDAPRRLRKTIRLVVPDPNKSDSDQVLEIDADGKSIINLQGMDLTRFGTVKLKGSDSAIVNALNMAGEEASDMSDGENTESTGGLVHRLELEPDYKFEFESLKLNPKFGSGSRVKHASLRVRDTGNNIVLYTQSQLRLGRSRDAELVTRFLPRSQENDQDSRNLSRVHVLFEFTEDGLVIRNQSSSGFEFNLKHHEQDEHVLLAKELVNEECELGLGKFLGSQLRLILVPIGNKSLPEMHGLRERINDFAEVNHLRKSPLWRISAKTAWDCLRIERQNNLEEEEYVVICQTALVGSSHKLCGIAVAGLPSVAAHLIYLGNSFFIGPTHSSVRLEVNEVLIERNELAALTIGDVIKINDVDFEFEAYQQLYM